MDESVTAGRPGDVVLAQRGGRFGCGRGSLLEGAVGSVSVVVVDVVNDEPLELLLVPDDAAVGLVVTPPKNTTRVPMSMNTNR